VVFTDGTEQRIDFGPVLRGALFGPLQDPTTFNAVTLDAEAGTLVSPNGADFDPATLHDWPQVRDQLAARARDWVTPESNQQRAHTRMGRRAAEGGTARGSFADVRQPRERTR
jgi:hypothetical protein